MCKPLDANIKSNMKGNSKFQYEFQWLFKSLCYTELKISQPRLHLLQNSDHSPKHESVPLRGFIMSITDKGFSEKRDFIRMKISAPLNAKLSHNDGIIEGLCRDLSGGGMQVETATEIALNTDLIVEISSDHGHNPTLHAKARVARCSVDTAQGFLLGLEIVEVLN